MVKNDNEGFAWTVRTVQTEEVSWNVLVYLREIENRTVPREMIVFISLSVVEHTFNKLNQPE